jgi:hypothetical protein
MFPRPMAQHLQMVKLLHEQDVEAGFGEVHLDVRTTMIYTHVLNRGGRGVRSPLDQ